MKTTSKLIISTVTLLALIASAYAQFPREQLQQLTAQLQKTPNDNALRGSCSPIGEPLFPSAV